MKIIRKALAILALTAMLLSDAHAEEPPQPAHELPNGFCYVHEVIPDVILDIRYAGTYNFVGSVIDGYEAPYAVMTEKAAAKLKEAADELRAMGYRLKIFDAYRPQSAVRHFLRWANDPSDTCMQADFYPEFKKKTLLVDQGYIARNSSHCRGSAVDLTITDLDGEEIDMGTGFDYFGALAWHGARNVTPAQAENRLILKTVMEKHGFKSFAKEWWHYRLISEPFKTAFDFPVK